ncbi:diacylglycerol kinase family protein [Alkalicoccus luteus]|uniref:Diacylglycerol kinase family protein n=1 Tax=Alkalicoccus luteus TaxID=1237094 RepID=A0A969TTP3_9BACI|nr:diacylglycerol kinase family protein [Alkalicoccus luteus]NJP36490.1 diacylglycerol kinase family protein [Alkalicoccus luteus]
MVSKNNNSFISIKRLKQSFRYAAAGIGYTWRHEQNFRIHSLAAAIVFTAAQLLDVPLLEQAVLAAAIGAVLCLELLNTSIEHITDLIVQTYDERAKIIKDTAAGAVLVFSCTAALIGCLIFIPKIAELVLQ